MTKTSGFTQKVIGQFSGQLNNAVELLEGQPFTIELDKFKKSDQTDLTTNPKAYISIGYINSFFTRIGRGKLTLKVKSVSIYSF